MDCLHRERMKQGLILGLVLGYLICQVKAISKTCNCSCYNIDKGIALDPVVQEKVNNITKELEIDSKSTNAHLRTLTSASDTRPSAAATGYVGIILLSVVFGFLVLLDFTGLFRRPDLTYAVSHYLD